MTSRGWARRCCRIKKYPLIRFNSIGSGAVRPSKRARRAATGVECQLTRVARIYIESAMHLNGGDFTFFSRKRYLAIPKPIGYADGSTGNLKLMSDAMARSAQMVLRRLPSETSWPALTKN